MAAVQQTFTSALSWTLEHPWGTVHPAPVVVDSLGHTRLVAPEYGDGEVTVTFSVATAGTFTLIGPNVGETSIALPSPSPSFARPPFSNAVLVEIRQHGTPDKYGNTSDDGDPMWAGQAAGYLKKQHRTVPIDGRSTRVLQHNFWIRDITGVPVIEEAAARWEGSTVTIDDMRTGAPVRRRYQCRAFEHRATGTRADNVLLELYDERPVA